MELERFSPILKRKMENEIEKLKRENQKLRDMILEQVTLGTRCLQILNN